MYEQGKYVEAEEMYRACVVVEDRIYPNEQAHPGSLLEKLATKSNLGNALDEQGKHGEAEGACPAVYRLFAGV